MNAAELIAATWPPDATHAMGSVTLRDGAGGGKRVSAASVQGPLVESDLDAADAPLYVVWPGQDDLDAALAARGYAVVDPTLILSCAAVDLAHPAPPPVSGFSVWPPLQVQKEIWANGGVGPARLSIMNRAVDPKVSILGRAKDKPAGTAFVAIHGGTAMIHAVEVRPDLRRCGLGTHMMRHAARWAMAHGADRVSVLVTAANDAAIALYRGLGLTGGQCYHYRVRPEGSRP